MNDVIQIKFDPRTAIQVNGPLVNPYGFDLTDPNMIGFTMDTVKFTVMGFRATSQLDTLFATVKVSQNPHIHDEYTYVQKINLYEHERVNIYCRTSAFNLKVNESDIKKGISSLRERLERYRIGELKTNKREIRETSATKKEIAEAREILKADNLMECIEGLLEQSGIVTEKENAMRLFLLMLSRHFETPLHTLLQGSPKLSRMLLDGITDVLPLDALHHQTSMSPSSMYYSRDREYWKNKVVHLGSIDKNFKAAPTIREFIENNFLSRCTTETDYLTKQLYASNKTVSGPICIVGYSEDNSLNERFFQECFFIRLTENEKNRKEVLEYEKRKACGLVDTAEKDKAKRLLKELQRQIEPKHVIIPFAMELELPERIFQPLRSFPQLITFIKTITLMHQQQLKTQTDGNGIEYIEATPEHLEVAFELFKELLIVRSDYLSHNGRNFLERLKMLVGDKEKSFKATEITREMKLSKSSFYREFNSLKDLGYIEKCGGDKKKGLEYKILRWNDYQDIQDGMKILDEQLKKIKEEVSQKIPRSFPKQIKVTKRSSNRG